MNSNHAVSSKLSLSSGNHIIFEYHFSANDHKARENEAKRCVRKNTQIAMEKDESGVRWNCPSGAFHTEKINFYLQICSDY